MKFYKGMVSGVLLIIFLSLTTTLCAAEIRIINNKTLTVTGKTLSGNCSDTFIESGSSLILNTALFQDMGRRTGDGTVTLNESAIEKCYKTFYVIPNSAGTASVICL